MSWVRLPELQGYGLDGDPRVGNGPSICSECRRARWRPLHRLGLRHGAGEDCDAALRHPGHTDSLRFGREIPVPDLAMRTFAGERFHATRRFLPMNTLTP